jgi:hypothetical protein
VNLSDTAIPRRRCDRMWPPPLPLLPQAAARTGSRGRSGHWSAAVIPTARICGPSRGTACHLNRDLVTHPESLIVDDKPREVILTMSGQHSRSRVRKPAPARAYSAFKQ